MAISEERKKGREFTKGVLDVLCGIVVAGWVLWFLLMIFTPTDNSDKGRFDRSGVKIVTDAKTGVEYLAWPQGGIIERKP
jgi:hypothetical protein